MTDQQYVRTPLGRLVQGHPMQGNDKDFHGKPLTDGQGNPREEFYFALAIEKTNPEWPAFMQYIQQVAAAGFPGGEYNQAGFAWKIVDGDHPDHATKEGFKGHYVVKLNSGFVSRCFTRGAESQITDASAIKRGDFLRVSITCKPNGNKQHPGVFINHHLVELYALGEAIVSGPAPGEMFSDETALPAGATALPAGYGGGIPQAAPAAPQPAPLPMQAANPMAPQPTNAGAPLTAAAVTTHSAPAGTAINPAVTEHPPGVQPVPGFLTPSNMPQ